MAEVNLAINGKSYGIFCDEGQESRVMSLGRYIDQRMREIARAGAAGNESHLMILTALMLADEAMELREGSTELERRANDALMRAEEFAQDEVDVAQAIGKLAQRIDVIAGRLKAA